MYTFPLFFVSRYCIAEQVAEARDDGNECGDSAYYLQVVALFAYTSLVYRDLLESGVIWSYLALMPRAKEFVEITTVMEDAHGNAVRFKAGEGITTLHYWWAVCGVVLPKMAVAAALWWYGCGFLVLSGNTGELHLNAVALVFILDIDDYSAFPLTRSPKQDHTLVLGGPRRS